MDMFTEIGTIIASPLGSLVYHFLLLLTIEAALLMVWGEWRRARQEARQRLSFAMGGLLLVRLPYLAVAALAFTGWVDPTMWGPPLEHVADAASIGLLGWAFMPSSKQGVRIWDLVFGANLLALLGVCSAFLVFWSGEPQPDYNDSWQAIVWMVWQMGLLLLASLAIFRSREEGWGTFFLAVVVWFLGTIGQGLFPSPAPHVPVWERLGNLVAYPLLAVAVYQDIVTGLRLHSRQLQDISQASLDQIKSLLFLFDASHQMSVSLDLSAVLENAVRGIARTLGADQCAIALPEEKSPDQIRLVAIYNPGRQGRGEQVLLPRDPQSIIQQAMRRKRHMIPEQRDHFENRMLFALMGSGEVGPLLVQPLIAQGEAIGAIIVGNAQSQRPFTPNEAKLCRSMADQLVVAIQNARRHQAVEEEVKGLRQLLAEERRTLEQARTQVQELTEQLANVQSTMEELSRREKAAREEQKALEVQWRESRAEAEALTERLAILETDLKQAHENAEAQLRWHREEMARRQLEWEETLQSAEWAQAAIHGLTAGILLANLEGVIQEANVAAEILLDRDRDDLLGLELAAISDDERWHQALASAGEGEAVRLAMQVGTNTLMGDVAPLPDLDSSQDRVKGIIVILQDISAEIEERRTHLETIASMAEELRTPITTVISYADLLLSEAVGIIGEAQRRFLLRLKASAERMVQMVNDLARMSGGEERWTSPQRQPVDLNKLIESTVAGASVQLEDRSLTLDLELLEDLPDIQADPDYLRRILSNLLLNACLASPLGGRIRIRTSRSYSLSLDREHPSPNSEGFVVVSIQDSGGGLSEEALSRVFDRMRPSQTPPGLGESGAGLSLVKTLVEAHGGRLWVESEKGVGTTFSFILPVNVPARHPLEVIG
ncbi:MAG: GAF domain-containing sensor histidine kinase [Anaerolineae bacterium]